MGVFLSRNVIVACRFWFHYIFCRKVAGDSFLRPRKKVVRLTSRTGRNLQRYDEGCRQVVGCIPYRYKSSNIVDGRHNSELEVLMISAQKGHGIMQFPKGGWEMDESMEQAALRETLEEAGVEGKVQGMLGKWRYKSKRQSVVHEGHMFPLLVNKQLEDWPEKNIRTRIWEKFMGYGITIDDTWNIFIGQSMDDVALQEYMSVSEAKEICPYAWMKEALDELICRQQDAYGNGSTHPCRGQEEEEEAVQVHDHDDTEM